MLEHPTNILEQYWGFTEFRPLQEDIISAVLNGQDTLALLPTGGGKSLCFQIPALIKSGICIVVSPLIALINDQVKQLHDKGIKAIALTGGISSNELITHLDNAVYGNYKFLYLSPERLQQSVVQERIKEMNVNLIAVDEAHCISQWGNDFRPAYLTIKTLRDIHPSVNCIALTASATPKVSDDIIKSLEFIDTAVFKKSFYRANLTYEIVATEDKLFGIKKIVSHFKGSSIVYVRNRRATITTSEWLTDNGFKAAYYHGGLSKELKNKHQELWINNTVQIMVATNAFGLGINKPDVQTVLHINLPESLESYFQEAGRAGRNGEPAYAILLKNKNDQIQLKSQFIDVLPTVKDVKFVYKKLNNYFQVAYGEGENSAYNFNFNLFCKTYGLNPTKTYNALKALDRLSVVQLTTQFIKEAKLQFIVPNHQLLNYIEKNKAIGLIVKTILRTYGGVFDIQTSVNIETLIKKTEQTEKKIAATLIQLEKDGILSLKLLNTDAVITFIEPREDDRTINRIAKYINQQNEIKIQHVNDVIRYVNDSSTCHQTKLVNYFGEQLSEPCGVCKICRPIKKLNSDKKAELQAQILTLLKQTEFNSRGLLLELQTTDDQLKSALKDLLEHKKIKITTKNTYTLV